MKLVKDSFLENIERELMAAISLDFIVGLGRGQYSKNSAEWKGKYRHGFISVNEEDLGNFANANVAVEDAFDFVNDNPNMIFEIFHGLMIQSWFQFLSGIHVDMVYDMRHGFKEYKLEKTKILIEPEMLSKDYLADAIRIKLSEDFDFQSAKERIRIVSKGLGVKLTDLEPELALITQEILVRNLVQHNKGEVRQDDIRQNGGPFTRIDVTTSERAAEKFSQGTRIGRDLHDLRKLAVVFARIAGKLLPDEHEN